MAAYYNEIDPFAAAWLRELIKEGHIADGEVDERSIVDVRPSELLEFSQCHFFAGIGVWSYALRRAGWADDRPVWTGSCPCQPFSAAGKGGGFDDERHLWPHFHWLISQCRPAVVLGEQVASKDGLAWLDLVQADLEGTGYASGAVDTCAAGFGAPHIRQRLYWVAHAMPAGRAEGRASARVRSAAGGGGLCCMDNSVGSGLEGQRDRYQAEIGRNGEVRPTAETGKSGRVADAACVSGSEIAASHDAIDKQRSKIGRRAEQPSRFGADGRTVDGDNCSRRGEIWTSDDMARVERPGPTNGHWQDADWLFCRDEKWRPVEPGTFPLAHGAAARVGRLRGYGNAINAEQAAAFCEAVLEVI